MDAAAEIFAAKGVRASTLEELAGEFGVTKPALYYYVKSKQQLLWMIFEQCYQEGVRAGVFSDLDVHAVVGGILGMCNWLHQWYDPRGRVKPDEITTLYADLLE